MNEMFNIYCDESCHLENDRQPVMLLGGAWCPLTEVPRLAAELRDIRERHRIAGKLKIKRPTYNVGPTPSAFGR